MLAHILTRPLVSFAAGATSVTCDGNSLTAGTGASGAAAKYPAVLATLPPLVGGSTPVLNIGVGGQQASQMTSSQADVTASWVSGKTNILVAWELTNTLQAGSSAETAVADLLAYVTSVKSTHGWRVAVLTAIPRFQNRTGDIAFTQTEVNTYNALIDSANALLRASWRGVADLLIDLRATGSPFAFSDYAATTFTGSGLYVNEAWAGGTARVHCSDAGYAAVASLVAAGLRRMPK